MTKNSNIPTNKANFLLNKYVIYLTENQLYQWEYLSFLEYRTSKNFFRPYNTQTKIKKKLEWSYNYMNYMRKAFNEIKFSLKNMQIVWNKKSVNEDRLTIVLNVIRQSK